MAAEPNENHERPQTSVNKIPQKDPRQLVETDRMGTRIHVI